MSATVPLVGRQGQGLALALGQRVGALAQRGHGQRRVHDALAARHPPDRVGELRGRGVLEQEAGRAGLHGSPQVARAGRTS